MNSPRGFLGARWGDDSEATRAVLGLSSGTWEKWEGNQGFEACFDIDHPVRVFGQQAYARLFRNGSALEGLSVRFVNCGAVKNQLSHAIQKQFEVKSDSEPLYTVFDDGGLVHFSFDQGDGTCQLTVAGASFGRAFASYLLETGFKSLFLGPR